ncbi:hypothetical protein HNY73_021668 [Argiope bruennichi]|uniref:Uncharacterized protein n=1 Tax=Argiope bruennichi TaxID=94029 RepID=A0A8T0E2H1_ARGBR|nr:hypothetical protein HNY73_021668 [Argiope bruennichi]
MRDKACSSNPRQVLNLIDIYPSPPSRCLVTKPRNRNKMVSSSLLCIRQGFDYFFVVRIHYFSANQNFWNFKEDLSRIYVPECLCNSLFFV